MQARSLYFLCVIPSFSYCHGWGSFWGPGTSSSVSAAVSTNAGLAASTANITLKGLSLGANSAGAVVSPAGAPVIYSGFINGSLASTTGVVLVEAKFDSGSYSALSGIQSFKIALPTGTSMLRDFTKHTLTLRITDSGGNTATSQAYSFIKGLNHDFNGDGYPDAVFSSTGYTTSTGRVYVFYSAGTAGITNTTLGAPNLIITGQAASDNFGGGVATGDLNGDGYADLIVGAYGVSTNNGKVYVFYSGGSSGLGSGSISASSTTNYITGPVATAYFGTAVMAGDVNGDGYSDIIVGADGVNNAYIFHTSALALGSFTYLGNNLLLTGGAGFGHALATGNTNGDNYTDLAVGAGSANTGYLFISQGSSGLPGAATYTISGETAGDSFGDTVAIGDVNGDGFWDLAVGAGSYSAGGGTGRAYVFHATAGGLATSTAASANTKITGPAASSFFAQSITLGDVNGDGYADLAAGAYGTSGNTGTVYIFQASGSSGITASTSASANSSITGEAANDKFGNFISLGDINGDGYIDLISGAWQNNSGAAAAGRGYVFYAATTGIASGLAASASTKVTGTTASENLGYRLW